MAEKTTEELTKEIEELKKSVSDPELVEMEIDGKQVKVQKEAVDFLTQKEHDLTSRNEKLLAEGRAKNEAEQKEHQEQLKQDLINLNEVLSQGATDLNQYKPLIVGGDGEYHGTIEEPVAQTPRQTVKTPNTFEESKLTEIEKQNKELLSRLDAREKADADDAIAFMEGVQKTKYKYADADAVLGDMRGYYETHGRAPSESKITAMLKTRHEKIAKSLPEQQRKEVEPAPDTRGPSVPTKTKAEDLPALSDVDAWAKRGKDKIKLR